MSLMVDSDAHADGGSQPQDLSQISIDDVQQRVAQAAFGRQLVTNVLRGHVAEAIIAFALEPAWQWCGADYSNWDFEHADGLRLEVKQSSARQTWLNTIPSKGSFDIAMRKKRWEAEGWIAEEGRAADLYIFAWHPVSDESADHRDPGQWEFFVVATADLPPSRRIGLAKVRQLAPPCSFTQLADRVAAVAQRAADVGASQSPIERGAELAVQSAAVAGTSGEPEGPDAPADMGEMHFKKPMLEKLGLPNIGYPISSEAFAAAIANGGELPFAEMLFGLQAKSRSGTADWQSLEPAIARLAELIAPDDPREIVDVCGDNWWLEIGPVDLDGPIVTIQRQDMLIAAISPRHDGRLRIACYRPLDAKSANYLIGLALNPHPEHGVVMRENNWKYAKDCSAGAGNWYADDRGEAYLSWWEAGIGVMQDGTIDEPWRQMRNLPPRKPAHIAMELGIRYALGED
jgi:hypothetical protein